MKKYVYFFIIFLFIAFSKTFCNSALSPFHSIKSIWIYLSICILFFCILQTLLLFLLHHTCKNILLHSVLYFNFCVILFIEKYLRYVFCFVIFIITLVLLFFNVYIFYLSMCDISIVNL